MLPNIGVMKSFLSSIISGECKLEADYHFKITCAILKSNSFQILTALIFIFSESSLHPTQF